MSPAERPCCSAHSNRLIPSRLSRSTHMQDLQEVTQEVHYENYRSERLAKGVKKITINSKDGDSAPLIINDRDRILQEKEDELKRMHEMIAQMKAKIAQK